jgi:hypothetical protein
LRDLKIPDVGINVVYRKTTDKPFSGALESSTSVGAISGGITENYQGSAGTSTGVSRPPLSRGPLVRRIASALEGRTTLYQLARRVYRTLIGR